MSYSIPFKYPKHVVGSIKRHASTKVSPAKSHRTLPDAKMRALISLYHQADTFITPENLSKRIDDAFVPDKQVEDRTGIGRQMVGLSHLREALREREKAPRAAQWDDESLLPARASLNAHWSSLKTARELKVVEALYGVNATQVGEVLPGLETVEEAESIPEGMSEETMHEYLGKKI